MNLPRNVGRLDAYLRITLGLATLVWGASRRLGWWGPVLTLAGAMKVAEGITGYCPMLHALGARTTEAGGEQSTEVETGSEEPRRSEPWPSSTVTGRGPRFLRTGRTSHLSED